MQASSLKLQGQRRSDASSPLWYEEEKNAEESLQSRAKLQGSETDQWLNLSRTASGSESKTSNTIEKQIEICNVVAGHWPVHNLEPNTVVQ